MNTSLVIMAAGLGSRYKDGIKQLAAFGPNGETLMEYSIYDALKAGFNKVVFILREDILEEFKKTIGKRVEEQVKTEYVIQSIDDIPAPYQAGNRTKPWGTAHAILTAKDKIDEPFCVINADDYYGKNSFKLVYDFLVNNQDDFEYCMAGYILKNTISNNGSVKRGICQVDQNGYLVDIKETFGIERDKENIISSNGILDENAKVSLNIWGFKPNVLTFLEDGFVDFLRENVDYLDGEYLLPIVIDDLLKKQKIKIKVLDTNDHWFGITYKEDYEEVKKALDELYQKGEYQDMGKVKQLKK